MKPVFRMTAVLLALCFATRAGGPPSVLGYTASSSFWLDLPEGWQVDAATAERTGAMFVLLPKNSSFDTTPVVIVGSAVEHSTLEEAMAKDRAAFLRDDPQMEISTLRSLVAIAGARFTLRKFRSKKLKQQGHEAVAYHQEGPDVILVTLSAQSEEALRSRTAIYKSLLRTYKTANIKAKKST